MDNLEFRIGGLKIENLKRGHKFIVGECNGVVSIYVAYKTMHIDVAEYFGFYELIDNVPYVLDKNSSIVGGGRCYLDDSGKLILDDYSGSFDGITKEVALKFGELMKIELLALGMNINGILAKPDERFINYFWVSNPNSEF